MNKAVVNPNNGPHRNGETTIFIDITKVPAQSHPNNNIKIAIENLRKRECNEAYKNSRVDPRTNVVKVKIKMPSTITDQKDCGADKTFFNEKDFSTLPKEFINFANSMICDDYNKISDKNTNANKSTNESKNLLLEKQSLTLETPKSTKTTVESTKSLSEVLKEIHDERARRAENSVGSKRSPQYGKIRKIEVDKFKPYKEAAAKFNPYSNYRLKYLNNFLYHENLTKDASPTKKDALPEFKADPKQQNEKKPVERSHPIMGKNALLSMMNKHHDNDSEIISKIVTEKFTPFFERRELSKKNRQAELLSETNDLNKTLEMVDNDECAKFDEDYEVRREIEDYLTFSSNKDDKIYETTYRDDENLDASPIKRSSLVSSFSSEYDAEKFVANAIGECSFSTLSLSLNQRTTTATSDDRSIATVDMSQLVSKASSVSTFCSNIWQRITRRNSPKALEMLSSADEDGEEELNERKNRRVALLKQEILVQEEIARQACKALEYCEGAQTSPQLIEAHRVHLIASHKIERIHEELDELEVLYARIRYPFTTLGCVTIKDVVFELGENDRGDDYNQWFLCILSKGTEVNASVLTQADDDGKIVFQDRFKFDCVPPDFEINLSLFSLKIKKSKNSRGGPLRRMFSNFRREPKHHTLSFNMSRMSLRSPLRDTQRPVQTRAPSFRLIANSTITIGELAETNLTLASVQLSSNIRNRASLSIECAVNIREHYSSFLNVGVISPKKTTWERRWCTLQDTTFKYWNSPDDEETSEPLLAVDMARVREVQPADRSMCPRARTLFFEACKANGDLSTVKLFLSCDTMENMHCWERCLNSVAYALRIWRLTKTEAN